MYQCTGPAEISGKKTLCKKSPGANPYTYIELHMYNANAVKICNSRNSVARFKNKNIFSYFKKSLIYCTAGVVVVKSRRIGS
jgi:hypothetical protein